MLIKINNKPLVVKEEPEHDGNPIITITLAGISLFFGLYVLDYASTLFLGYSPFPIIRMIIQFFGGV